MPSNRTIDPAVDDIGIETIPGARPVTPRPGRKRPQSGAARPLADGGATRRAERSSAPKRKVKSEPSYNFISHASWFWHSVVHHCFCYGGVWHIIYVQLWSRPECDTWPHGV